MTKTARALKAFYSGFDIPAYSENDVPDDVDLPYITYSVADSDFGAPVTHQCRVWYRDTTPVAAFTKADEIVAAIGSGVMLDGVCIRPGNPLMQKQPTEDELQVVYINLQLDTYHMIGV